MSIPSALKVLLAPVALLASAPALFAAGPFLEDRSCETLAGWTAALQSARAELSFRDDVFAPLIGKTFDQLSDGERETIGKKLRDCFRGEWTPFENLFLNPESGDASSYYQSIAYVRSLTPDQAAAYRAGKRVEYVEPAFDELLAEVRSSEEALEDNALHDAGRLSSLDSVRRWEDKCEVLLTWLDRLPLEYPGLRLSGGTDTASYWIHAFLDEEFVPVFGQPYDETTEEWRTQIHDEVLYRCINGGRQLYSRSRSIEEKYLRRFAPYAQLLNNAFNSYAADHLRYSALIAEGRQQTVWMHDVLAALSSQDAALVSRTAREVQAQADQQLSRRWPSERRRLARAVVVALASSEDDLLSDWLTPAAPNATIVDAVQMLDRTEELYALISAYSREERDRVLSEYAAKLDRLLAVLVQQRIEELRALPLSAEVGRQSDAWKQRVFEEFSPFLTRDPVIEALAGFPVEREKLLEALAARRAELGIRVVTFESCNLLPLGVSQTFAYETSPSVWAIEGPIDFAAGECKSFDAEFQNVDARFYRHTFAAGDVAAFLFDFEPVVINPQNGLLCVPIAVPTKVSSDELPCESGSHPAFFGYAGTTSSDYMLSVLSLDEKDIPLPYFEDGNLDLEAALQKIQLLSRWLPRRIDHRRQWLADVPRPYSLGIVFEDTNGPFTLGVDVVSSESKTPFEVPINFQVGDRIAWFDGYPIYAREDLEIALLEFAEDRSKGVMKTAKFRVWRGSDFIEHSATFFFNQDFWPVTTAEETDALAEGFWSGFTAGILNGPDWDSIQYRVRLKQMYPVPFQGAQLIGSILLAIATAEAATILTGGRLGLVGGAMLSGIGGAAEAALLTINEAVPGSNPNNILPFAVRNGAGIGFVVGLVF